MLILAPVEQEIQIIPRPGIRGCLLKLFPRIDF